MLKVEGMKEKEPTVEILFNTNEWKSLHFMLEQIKKGRD